MRTITKYILIFWIPLISGKAIILDGNLDEPEWESAFVIDEYYEVVPFTLNPAKVKTTAKIFSNEEGIYVGFINYQENSSMISFCMFSIELIPKNIKLNSFEEFSSKITLIDQMPESQIGGETKAFELMHSFLEERGNGYAFKMSSPVEAEFACSRLSTHIAFGSISLKTVYQSLLEAIPNSSFKKDLFSFKKRLHWHCHFIQKLETEPELEFSSMHPMCDKLRGDGDNEIIEKWIKGETGFPFLDAVSYTHLTLPTNREV